MTRTKRGNKYIDPLVQGALWKRLVLHWITYIAVACLLALGMEWMSDPFRSFSQMINDTWWTYGPMMMVLLVLIPIFIYDSIRLSHRFVGPVFRLRQVIKSLAGGLPSERLEFRDNDFWREISQDMNHVMDRLSEQSPPVRE